MPQPRRDPLGEDLRQASSLWGFDFTLTRQVGGEVEVTRKLVAFSIVKPEKKVLPEGEPETLVAV